MKRGSGLGLFILSTNLSCDDLGQLSRADATNPCGRSIDPIAAEGTGKLLFADFFVSHKARALGADALPLHDFFARIAGIHTPPPFS